MPTTSESVRRDFLAAIAAINAGRVNPLLTCRTDRLGVDELIERADALAEFRAACRRIVVLGRPLGIANAVAP